MMSAHTDDMGSLYGIEQRAVGEKIAQQNEFEEVTQAEEPGSNINTIAARDDSSGGLIPHSAATEGEYPEPDPGFGLGLPGLASLTLPSEGMVVPPLNFAMVSNMHTFVARPADGPSKLLSKHCCGSTRSVATLDSPEIVLFTSPFFFVAEKVHAICSLSKSVHRMP